MSLAHLIVFNKEKQFLRAHPDIAGMVVNIIEQKEPWTLRILEHLITNYAAKYALCLDEHGEEAATGSGGGGFCVQEEYRKNLPKTELDPCQRGPRVSLPYCGRLVETTLPQLKCVIWIVSTPILAYARHNYEAIRKDLNIDKRLEPKKKDTSHIVLPPRSAPAVYALV